MNPPDTARPAWRRSRYGFAGFFVLSFVAACTVLRIGLLIGFKPEGPVPAGEVVKLFFSGLHRDIFVALVLVLPSLAWFAAMPNRWFTARWHRLLVSVCFCLFWAGQSFLFATEVFFFEEFHSRFNTVAVDYLLYPHEVFINIWESYPVVPILIACAVCGLLWTAAAAWLFRGEWNQPAPRRMRLLWLGGALVVIVALSQTLSIKGARVSAERTLNEIANNGALAFVAAAVTRHLDYAAFYRTLPRAEALERARHLLAEPGTEFTGDAPSLRRKVSGDLARPKLNVMLILEESLGSEFWGTLGRTNKTLMPEMDKLANEEGMLFTHIYASGNRTVRGLEGVLASFPPLPGDSVVVRDRSENIETLARVLGRDGYTNLFLYGGRGIFDNMRPFMLRNGYHRFIEFKHFENPSHATIWGVADEDLFKRTIAEARAMHQSGQPFFTTALTVSNHKPFTYPEGRIPEDPNKRWRSHAVKYSDYALGLFFRLAKQEAFWTNTIFIVVADHGARVYGSQSIPIKSYEIPFLIAGPAVVKQPTRVPHLGCSLDVAPTILGLIGRPYETMFFGRDLLNSPPDGGRVMLHHNRNIGMFTRDRMVSFGLNKSVEYYTGDPKRVNLRDTKSPDAEHLEVERNATAVFQVADELYMQRRYNLDAAPVEPGGK